MIKGSLLIDANLPNSTGDDNVTAVTHNNTFPHHLITSEDFPNWNVHCVNLGVAMQQRCSDLIRYVAI